MHAVYLISGGYDLLVSLEGKTLKEVFQISVDLLAELQQTCICRIKCASLLERVDPLIPDMPLRERKDLEEIAEVIERHDLFVLSDEIYAELCYTDKHVSIANIPGMWERTILINGFSKSLSPKAFPGTTASFSSCRSLDANSSLVMPNCLTHGNM